MHTCLVETCTRTTRNPERAGWQHNQHGQYACPQHPLDTSCRVCGDHLHGELLLCDLCALV